MIKRLWPWVAAIVLLVGVAGVVGGYVRDNTYWAGMAAANRCFVAHGYTYYDNRDAPRDVFERCMRPAREAEAETWSFVAGGGAGLLVAVLLLAGVFGWRAMTTPEEDEQDQGPS